MGRNTAWRVRKKRLKKKYVAWGLVILTIMITLLSIKAQYRFWNGLFGQETAVISSALIEIMRLAALFTMLKLRGKKKIAGIAIYVALALFCGSVAITSWNSEIIEEDDRYHASLMQAYQVQIDQIKTAYSEQQKEKIAKLEKDIYWSDSKLASNPNSSYWQRRREQLVAMKEELLQEMDGFLSESPADPRLWIEKNAARLGIEVEAVLVQESQYASIEKA
ncbi:hypothetical protein BVY01_04860, partial [bacterium I07]